MGKKLTGNVYVDDVLYVAGAEPSKEVAAKITNPKLWEGDSAAGDDDSSDKGYADLKVDKLKAEIEKRNEARLAADPDAELISTEGLKADHVAALEADDAANDSDDE